MKKIIFLLSMLWLISSCTPQSEAISYGSDMCDFCKMSIVDPQHGAELVTTKAKVFKFDAIECMINFSKEKSNSISNKKKYALELVNIYTKPEELFPAQESYFLISQNLPSPMGANLTAFKNRKNAEEMQFEKGGEIYNWDAIQKKIGKENLTME